MVEVYPYKTETEKTPKHAVLRHKLRFLFIEFKGGNSSQFSRKVNLASGFCVFHSKLTTRFTNNLPLISGQNDQ